MWSTWTAPRSGTATFQSTLDNYNTQLAVYKIVLDGYAGARGRTTIKYRLV